MEIPCNEPYEIPLANTSIRSGVMVTVADKDSGRSKCLGCLATSLISSLLSLNREGCWGTTDDFTTSFFYFSLFSTALWDLANSRPVHFLMLSSHLLLCLPCHLPPFTVPCKMVWARPDKRETWPCHCSLRLLTMVRRSSCGPIACRILTRTFSLVPWSLYEMRSILR